MADGHAAHRDRHPVHEELGGYEGSKMGMWLFLATELLLFGVLFAGFTLFHAKFLEPFKLAHYSLDKWMGGLNTIVLIASSVTAVLALDSIQRGKRQLTNVMLAATLVLAGMFLVVKYFEYNGKFAKDIFPGSAMYVVKVDKGKDDAAAAADKPAGKDSKYIKVIDLLQQEGKAKPASSQFIASLGGDEYGKKMHTGSDGKIYEPNADGTEMWRGINLFFTFYFVMTAVHGLHVVIGMTVIAFLLYYYIKGVYSHWYYTHIENGTLYLHLVDLIWIYLFPLFYLVS